MKAKSFEQIGVESQIFEESFTLENATALSFLSSARSSKPRGCSVKKGSSLFDRKSCIRIDIADRNGFRFCPQLWIWRIEKTRVHEPNVV